MARLSTHVLDIAKGRPAAGLPIRLFRGGELLKTVITNADGRTDGALLEGERIPTGIYELVFSAGQYFGTPGDGFLGDVVVRFGVEDGAGNYHVPLLVAPNGYTTYRGS